MLCYLWEVGTTGKGEVVINHPDLPDKNGVGHIVLSVEEAFHLSRILSAKAHEAYEERLLPYVSTKKA